MTKDDILFIIGIFCGIVLIVGIIILGISEARKEIVFPKEVE